VQKFIVVAEFNIF